MSILWVFMLLSSILLVQGMTRDLQDGDECSPPRKRVPAPSDNDSTRSCICGANGRITTGTCTVKRFPRSPLTVCTPGKKTVQAGDGCNICICNPDGSIGGCTLMLCPDKDILNPYPVYIETTTGNAVNTEYPVYIETTTGNAVNTEATTEE